MQKSALNFLLVTVGLLSIQACTPPTPASRIGGKNCRSQSAASESLRVSSQPPSSETYNEKVAPILEKYCTSCHSAGGGQSPSLDNFAAAKLGFEASMAAVETGSMPPREPKMSAADVTTLKNWSSGGFLEKAESSTIPTPTPSPETGTETEAGTGTPSATPSSSADGTSGC